MGSIILFVVISVEFVLTFYSIYKKSDQIVIRNIIRIVSPALFLILVLSSVVKWGFQWYAFTLALLIWALMGAICLLRRKRKNTEFKKRKVLKRSFGLLIMAFLLLSPTLIFPHYEPLETTGKYKVDTEIYTYTDENRIDTYSDTREHRRITVQYWYPGNSNRKYPLIVFSHGSFGTKTSNLSMYRELASHGYVVCSIDHTYQCLFTTDVDGNTVFLDKTFRQEVFEEDAKSDKRQSREYYQKWMKTRTDDVNFVIDLALSNADSNDSDMVYRLIEAGKIGLMGHSLGGSAALGIGRSRRDVGAVMALESPFMCDIIGVENEDFVWNEESYPVPVLNIYSDSSWDRLYEWPQYEANVKLLECPGEDVFNVYIRGSGHLSLTDLALSSPFFTRILNGHKASIDTVYCLTTINGITLDFFDCYLKGKGEFAPQEFY